MNNTKRVPPAFPTPNKSKPKPKPKKVPKKRKVGVNE